MSHVERSLLEKKLPVDWEVKGFVEGAGGGLLGIARVTDVTVPQKDGTWVWDKDLNRMHAFRWVDGPDQDGEIYIFFGMPPTVTVYVAQIFEESLADFFQHGWETDQEGKVGVELQYVRSRLNGRSNGGILIGFVK